MRRFIRVSAVLVLLGLGIYGYHRKKDPEPRVKVPVTRYHGYELNRLAINRAKAFTVLISNESFGGVGRGTGLLIDPTHVLTCAHMVQGPQDDLWIFPYPVGVVVKGRPMFVDKSVDLAILELDKTVILSHYATFQEAHYDGEPITIIGNILGSMKWFISFGIISGDYQNFLLTDGLIKGGNSGGCWINEKGEVIAVTDWGLEKDSQDLGISGGISAKTVHAFLKEYKSSSMEMLLQMILGRQRLGKVRSGV